MTSSFTAHTSACRPLSAPKCGKEVHRVPEVIDCWFDSGSMPFAQHHYPFENKETFEKQFPAQFISEAVDQTRGWFYSLLAISTLLFNKAPYENVIVLGLVQDENGQKMSKSKGNAVDPFDALADLRCRCDPLVLLHQQRSVAAEPFRRQDGRGRTEKVHGNPVEHLRILCSVCKHRQLRCNKIQSGYEKLAVMDKWLLSRHRNPL